MDGISFTVHPWTLTPRAAAASGVPVVPRALGSPSACLWPPEALASPPDGRGRRGEGLPRPLLAGKNANETRALRRCKLWSAQDAAGRAWLPGDSLALPMGTRGQRAMAEEQARRARPAARWRSARCFTAKESSQSIPASRLCLPLLSLFACSKIISALHCCSWTGMVTRR